jgi:hypothetical protein
MIGLLFRTELASGWIWLVCQIPLTVTIYKGHSEQAGFFPGTKRGTESTLACGRSSSEITACSLPGRVLETRWTNQGLYWVWVGTLEAGAGFSGREKVLRIRSIRFRLTPKSKYPVRDADLTWITLESVSKQNSTSSTKRNKREVNVTCRY